MMQEHVQLALALLLVSKKLAIMMASRNRWVIFFICLTVIPSSRSEHLLNDTCIDLKFEALHNDYQTAFQHVVEQPTLNHAQVVGHDHIPGSEAVQYNVQVRWTTGNVVNGRYRRYMRKYTLNESNRDLIDVTEGSLRSMDNVQLMDTHHGSGATAELSMNDYGEQYLTVNTSQAQTSCTLRLNMYANIHGKVMTDDIFGVFKFSPDGRFDDKIAAFS
jgi:hypothetical protein